MPCKPTAQAGIAQRRLPLSGSQASSESTTKLLARLAGSTARRRAWHCTAASLPVAGKDGRDDLIEGMEHYIDPNDFNKRFYHASGEGSRSEACRNLQAVSASW